MKRMFGSKTVRWMDQMQNPLVIDVTFDDSSAKRLMSLTGNSPECVDFIKASAMKAVVSLRLTFGTVLLDQWTQAKLSRAILYSCNLQELILDQTSSRIDLNLSWAENLAQTESSKLISPKGLGPLLKEMKTGHESVNVEGHILATQAEIALVKSCGVKFA